MIYTPIYTQIPRNWLNRQTTNPMKSNALLNRQSTNPTKSIALFNRQPTNPTKSIDDNTIYLRLLQLK
jgi:hypothetical protein